VNKRATRRLIGVTALILAAVGAILIYTTSSGSAGAGAHTGASVEDVATDPELVGEKVKVDGVVVKGSWEGAVDPMEFDITDDPQGEPGGEVLTVVWDKTVPSSFGDGSNAIVTGTLSSGGEIEASELIIKCPSKYESLEGAMTIDELLADSAMEGTPTRVSGFVVAIEGQGVVLGTEKSGGTEIEVDLSETELPENVEEGTEVVVQGTLEGSVLVAESIGAAE
jgi:cytochrome c-type biogenesis protein CcmE